LVDGGRETETPLAILLLASLTMPLPNNKQQTTNNNANTNNNNSRTIVGHAVKKTLKALNNIKNM